MGEKIFSHYNEAGAVFHDAPDMKVTARICAQHLDEAKVEAARIVADAKVEAAGIIEAAVAKIKTAGG
jgi:hypothetical protein